ncbi:MAG: NYN domain-containing protein, partial [Clostridiales bacterium]|nr:NYN domain-containing protein [Clostridiales bacterium]
MDEMKFAVLIDSENVSYKYVKAMFEELSKYGIATYKRAYGDFSKENLREWEDVMREFAITPELQYSYTKGKNSSDTKMIIDAMDILYAGQVDGFCLVSSDSDFTGLARRLIESGKFVLGMGETKAPVSFINACNKFSFLNVLYQAQGHEDEAEQTPINEVKQGADDGISNITPESVIREEIIKILADSDDSEGIMHCGDIGNMLIKKFPDFDPRNYGYNKLTKLLSSIDSVFITQRGNIYYAALKAVNNKEVLILFITDI